MKEKIIFASIEPTNNCGLDCVTCSRSYLLRTFPQFKIGSINVRFLDKIRDILSNLTEIKFHGLGEPFLAKDTVLLHKRIRELYPKANLISITNAAMLNFPLKVKNYLDHIVVSIDHAQRDIFERLRRKAKYDVVISNVLKVTEKNTKHQPRITINSVFNADTYKDLDQMIILAKALGVKDVRFNLVQDWVEDERSNIKEIMLDKVNIDELAAAISYAFRIADLLDVSMRIIGNPEFEIEKCQWARRMIYITKDGQIAPCCMRTEPMYYFGSFLKKPFDDIWEGETMEKFRWDRTSGRYPRMCSNCPYLLNAAILKELKNKGVSLTNDFIGHKYRG